MYKIHPDLLDKLSLKNCDVFDEEYADCGSYNSSAWDWEEQDEL